MPLLGTCRILDGDDAQELRQPHVSLVRLQSGVLRRVAVVGRRRLPLPQKQLSGLAEAEVAAGSGPELEGLRVRLFEGESQRDHGNRRAKSGPKVGVHEALKTRIFYDLRTVLEKRIKMTSNILFPSE